MPCTVGSALSRSIVASNSAWLVSAGGLQEHRAVHPRGLAGVLLVPDVDLAGGMIVHEHDGQAGRRYRSVSRRPGHFDAVCSRIVWARAFPSRIDAGTSSFPEPSSGGPYFYCNRFCNSLTDETTCDKILPSFPVGLIL